MAIGLFWFGVALVVYTYIVYPLLLWLWTRLIRRPALRQLASTELPYVSVLIAAHDEEAVIVEKLANCGALDYPADRLEFLIGSDGSRDATEALVRAHAGPTVRLLAFRDWRGKAAVLNDLVAAARGEIVVFTDANTWIDPQAIRRLVAHFSDPQVGAVGGHLVLGRAGVPANAVRADESLYWRYETWIKSMEGQLGILAAAPGALHAERRALVNPLPTQRVISDDILLTARVLLQGQAVTYEPAAIAKEGIAVKTRGELQRKIRVAETAYNVLPYVGALLLPRHGRVAWGFWSHKIIRWLVPFLLVGLFSANVLLISQPFYQIVFVGQLLFYLAAVLGYLIESRQALPWWLSFPYYFAGANLALLLGCLRSLTRPATATWGRVAR